MIVSKQSSVLFNMWSYSFDHLFIPRYLSLFWDCPCPYSIYQISIHNILLDQILCVRVWCVCVCAVSAYVRRHEQELMCSPEEDVDCSAFSLSSLFLGVRISHCTRHYSGAQKYPEASHLFSLICCCREYGYTQHFYMGAGIWTKALCFLYGHCSYPPSSSPALCILLEFLPCGLLLLSPWLFFFLSVSRNSYFFHS